MPARRNILRLPLLAAPFLALPRIARGAADWPRRVSDALGREVTLSGPAKRVVLAESILLYSLVLIHPDPSAVLVGVGGDLRRGDPAGAEALARRFPRLRNVSELTTQVGQPLPVERVIGLQPDLVVMAAWQKSMPDTAQALRNFDDAGIPVVFVDLYNRPLDNVVPTMRLLGEALDRRDAAAAFSNFYEAEHARVRAAVAGRRLTPALLQVLPGLRPCCWLAGDEGLGELLAAAGGVNVARPALPTPAGGEVSTEQLLVLEPEVFIATGMVQPGGGGVRLGYGVSPAEARQSLAAALEVPELRVIPAVQKRRVGAIWNYSGGGMNILLLQALAGWLHPDTAAELDPAVTLRRINERFTASAWEGAFWTGL